MLLRQLLIRIKVTPAVEDPPALGHGFMLDVDWAAKRQDEELAEMFDDEDSEGGEYPPMRGGYA